MGLLSHPCVNERPDGTVCDRVELVHKGEPIMRSIGYRCPQFKRGDTPRVVETYVAPSLPNGKTQTLRITPPGVVWPPDGKGRAEKTCGCVACHDAFLREGGVAAECRCRPCAIAHAEQAEAIAANEPDASELMRDDIGPDYDVPAEVDE